MTTLGPEVLERCRHFALRILGWIVKTDEAEFHRIYLLFHIFCLPITYWAPSGYLRHRKESAFESRNIV